MKRACHQTDKTCIFNNCTKRMFVSGKHEYKRRVYSYGTEG